MEKNLTYDHWMNDGNGTEDDMEKGHQKFWERNLHYYKEKDLLDKEILDFGCNQGGFLRFLYSKRPFKSAVGVDLAEKAVAIAESRKGNLPVSYISTPDIKTLNRTFDIAVSTSVIYLIEDLKDHAEKIHSVLKPGGLYYTSYTDYNGNPNLPNMYQYINASAKAKMQLHALDHIAKAFLESGFSVELIRLQPIDFVEIVLNDPWHMRISERMQYEYEQAYLFRMTKR